jgi:hypothetical protein
MGGMLGYWLFTKNQETEQARQNYQGYLPAKAIIRDIYTMGIGKRSRTHYDLTLQLANGQWQNQSQADIGRGLLNRSYAIGDTILVYYNPENTNIPVIDEYELTTSTETSDYRNLLGYAVGALVVGIAAFVNRKEILQSLHRKN